MVLGPDVVQLASANSKYYPTLEFERLEHFRNLLVEMGAIRSASNYYLVLGISHYVSLLEIIVVLILHLIAKNGFGLLSTINAVFVTFVKLLI